MEVYLQILFWISLFVIFHSYVFYPFLLKYLPQKNKNKDFFTKEDELPFVSILMSLYNEEEVIAEKLESILKSNYPMDRIEVIIGSDNSKDATNQIVEEYVQENSNIVFFPFYERQGKQGVVNRIFEASKGDILILSDANVFFDNKTICELIKNYKNKEIGLVDTHMTNKGLMRDGISMQESAYISREVGIKNAEGNIWGTMMGPFGGCYSIRRELYEPVPANFLVDDFYINMKVLQKGYKAINNLDSYVYEDVSNNLKDEFKRKIRIATGNFQNLNEFKGLLLGLFGLNPFQEGAKNYSSRFGVSFSFLSHKVLRWVIPFFIVLMFIVNLFLVEIPFYRLTMVGMLIVFSLPLLDIVLKKRNIHLSILRFITHFLGMNLALLIGFFRWTKGVNSGIWEPTKRNQASKG